MKQPLSYHGDINEAIDSLWDEWFDEKSFKTRNKLFIHYSPWMNRIASSFFSRYRFPMLEWGDYVQYCAMGLIDAIEKYDRRERVPFKGYAYKRIKGEMLNGVTSFHNSKADTKKVVSESTSDLVSSVLSGEQERATNGLDSFDVILNVALDLAFERLLGISGEKFRFEQAGPLEAYMNFRDEELVVGLVDLLQEKEKQIVDLYYFKHLNFIAIADLMGLSKSRVSQIHSRAIRKLRMIYEEKYSTS